MSLTGEDLQKTYDMSIQHEVWTTLMYYCDNVKEYEKCNSESFFRWLDEQGIKMDVPLEHSEKWHSIIESCLLHERNRIK